MCLLLIYKPRWNQWAGLGLRQTRSKWFGCFAVEPEAIISVPIEALGYLRVFHSPDLFLLLCLKLKKTHKRFLLGSLSISQLTTFKSIINLRFHVGDGAAPRDGGAEQAEPGV